MTEALLFLSHFMGDIHQVYIWLQVFNVPFFCFAFQKLIPPTGILGLLATT